MELNLLVRVSNTVLQPNLKIKLNTKAHYGIPNHIIVYNCILLVQGLYYSSYSLVVTES